jgi:hypothetical protein
MDIAYTNILKLIKTNIMKRIQLPIVFTLLLALLIACSNANFFKFKRLSYQFNFTNN